MSNSPTPAAPPTVGRFRCRHWPQTNTQARHALGLATYYRLQSAVLEARVAALEAEVARTERRLQETVDRYEQVLQQPEEGWVVVTGHAPKVDSPTTDG